MPRLAGLLAIKCLGFSPDDLATWPSHFFTILEMKPVMPSLRFRDTKALWYDIDPVRYDNVVPGYKK